MYKKVEKMEVLIGGYADLKEELAKLQNVGKLLELNDKNTALKSEKEDLLADNGAVRKKVKDSSFYYLQLRRRICRSSCLYDRRGACEEGRG